MFTHIKIAKYQNTEKTLHYKKLQNLPSQKKRNKKLQNIQKGSRFNGCHQKNHKNFEKYSHLLVLSANRRLGQLNSVLTKKQQFLSLINQSKNPIQIPLKVSITYSINPLKILSKQFFYQYLHYHYPPSCSAVPNSTQ